MPKKPKFRCKNCDYMFSDFRVYLDKGKEIRVCPFCGGREFEELGAK